MLVSTLIFMQYKSLRYALEELQSVWGFRVDLMVSYGVDVRYHNHTDILSHFSGVGVDVVVPETIATAIRVSGNGVDLVFPRQRYKGLVQY